MSIHANEFKWEKGKNDIAYIRLLEQNLKQQQEVTWKAVAKLKKVSKLDQYENGVKDFAKYLIDKRVDDYSGVVDLVIAFLDKDNADPNPCDTKGCSTSTRQSCCGCPERLEWEKRRRKKREEYFDDRGI